LVYPVDMYGITMSEIYQWVSHGNVSFVLNMI
jgi:hypothetical protein